MQRKNMVKQLLAKGKAALGCFLRTPSVDMAQILGHSGFDFIIIDTEHGSMNPERITDLLAAVEVTGKIAIVRVAENSPNLIMHALDIGALGIHVPQVTSKQQALKVVQAIQYPPEGKRGTALVTRAAKYGVIPYQDYVKFAREEVLSIIAIEHIQAVENLSAILSIEGIDVVFIGHSDLSSSMGLIGQIDHPKVQKTIDKILKQVVKKGITAGIPAYTPEAARRRIDQGFRYITTTAEGIFLKGCQNQIQKTRDMMPNISEEPKL